MKKILRLLVPLLLVAVPLLGGAVAGEWLRGGPDAAPDAEGHAPDAAGGAAPADAADGHAAAAPAKAEDGRGAAKDGGGSGSGSSYFSFPQQFFVPIVRQGTLDAVMVLSLSVAVPSEDLEGIAAKEARLRDALLRALLIHANTGGFDGNFTGEARLELLRTSLREAARGSGGDEVQDVLIGDIVRQES